MDKEEILAKSRQENQNRDMEDLQVQAWAIGIAAKVGLMICCLLSVLEVLFRDSVSTAGYTIFFAILGITMILKYVKLRRKHELAVAVLYLALFVFFFVLHLCGLVRGA